MSRKDSIVYGIMSTFAFIGLPLVAAFLIGLMS